MKVVIAISIFKRSILSRQFSIPSPALFPSGGNERWCEDFIEQKRLRPYVPASGQHRYFHTCTMPHPMATNEARDGADTRCQCQFLSLRQTIFEHSAQQFPWALAIF